MDNQKNHSAKVRRKDGWQNLMTGLGSAKTAKKGFRRLSALLEEMS